VAVASEALPLRPARPQHQSAAEAWRQQLAGKLAVRSPVQLRRLVEAWLEAAASRPCPAAARGTTCTPGARGRARRAGHATARSAASNSTRTGATRPPRRRCASCSGRLGTRCARHLVIFARSERDHEGQRHARREGASHKYFTQISSFAASAVNAVTPGVPAIRSTVAGLALYAAVPFHTITASPKNTLRSSTAAGTVYLFQPDFLAGKIFSAGAGSTSGVGVVATQSTTVSIPSGVRQVWCEGKYSCEKGVAGAFSRSTSL
jgi:hypothetical protein